MSDRRESRSGRNRPIRRASALSPMRRVLLVSVPFTSAYLLSELFRNVNAVLEPLLSAEFHLAPSTMGLMTSAFLGALAGSQIFVGQALDRFGPKQVVVATLLIAVAASALFSLAQTPAMLVLARFLIGLGLSACWTGAYKANALWWPRDRLPLVNAITIAVAGLGSLAATAPAVWLLGRIDWREMFFGLAILAGAIAVLIAIAAPSTPTGGRSSPGSPEPSGTDTRSVITHPAFLAIVPASALCQGAWVAYQGLWAGVWLRDAVGLAPDRTADVLMGLALAVIAGQTGFGLLADRIARDDRRLFRLTFALTFCFVVLQVLIAGGPAQAQALLWMGYGLFTAGPILAYALLVRLLPQEVTGRAIALLNLGAVLSGFLLQGGLGAGIDVLRDIGWTEASAQKILLACTALLQAAALAWMALRRNAALGPAQGR